MNENLVGYLMHGLDDAETRQVEEKLQSDPEARRRLDLLRRALEPLAYDREPEAPPTGLVLRTLTRVAEQACAVDLPHAPTPAPRLVTAAPRWYRRADVLIAACILLTALALGTTAVQQARDHQIQLACQDNLRQLHDGMKTYQVAHGAYPNIASDPEHRAAGMIAPLLQKAGALPANVNLRCPAEGEPTVNPWPLEQIQKFDSKEFADKSSALLPSYGFTLGYRDDDGNHHPYVPDFKQVASILPMMADALPSGAKVGNSPNHRGRGQNVLYHDGHVVFAGSRNVGVDGDDIYLNKAFKVAAGLDRLDTVLGHSASQP